MGPPGPGILTYMGPLGPGSSLIPGPVILTYMGPLGPGILTYMGPLGPRILTYMGPPWAGILIYIGPPWAWATLGHPGSALRSCLSAPALILQLRPSGTAWAASFVAASIGAPGYQVPTA